MKRLIASAVGVGALTVLAGCGGGVTEMTRQQVARSETAVTAAQTTVGTSEAGAIELQQAKDLLEESRSALKAKKPKEAERYASQAQLTAELAVAKSQNAAARRAADDVLASVKTLRQETSRGTTTR